MKKTYLYLFLLINLLHILPSEAIIGGRITVSGTNFAFDKACSNDTLIFKSNTSGLLSNQRWVARNADNTILASFNGINFTINGNIPQKYLYIDPTPLTIPADNFISIEFNADSANIPITWTSATFNIAAGPDITMPTSPTLCQGAASLLLPTTTGVTLGDFSAQWFVPSLPMTTVNGESINASIAGIYTYQVKISSGARCQQRKTLTLSPVPFPIATVAGGNNLFRCAGQTLQLQASDTRNTGVLKSISWSPQAHLSDATILNPIVGTTTGVLPIDYTVTMVNSGNCTSSFLVKVRSNAPFVGGILTPNNSVLCKFPASTISTSITGGSLPYSYQWSPASGLNSTTVSAPIVTPLSFSGINYTMITTDAVGCKFSNKVTIKRTSLEAIAKTTPTANICVGNQRTFEIGRKLGISPFVFVADNALTKINDSTYITPIKNTTGNFLYVITVTDASGCSDKIELNITSDLAPNVIYGNQNTISGCVGQQVLLSVTSVVSGPISAFEWESKPELTATNTSIIGINVINAAFSITPYLLTLTGADANCKSVITTYIDAKPTPQIGITRISGELYINETISLNSTGTNGLPNLLWQFGDGNTATSLNPTHIYNVNKKYILTLTGDNNFGCTGRDTLTLKLLKKSTGLIYVPNTFLPNSDNIDNKSFKVFCEDAEINTEVFSAKIYNIFGKLVFDSSNYFDMKTKGWDGEGANSGVYTYIIEGQFVDEKKYSLPGKVSLIR